MDSLPSNGVGFGRTCRQTHEVRMLRRSAALWRASAAKGWMKDVLGTAKMSTEVEAARNATWEEIEDGLPNLEDYKVVGRIQEAYQVPSKPVFAVVEVGSHQFKVTPDDLIYTEKLGDAEVNDKLELGKVLLLGSTKETVIGRPYVPGASIIAAVEEQTQDAKVIIFKKKRRKNYRRTRGHRQLLTTLRVLDVVGIEP